MAELGKILSIDHESKGPGPVVSHSNMSEPSSWVARFSTEIRTEGSVADIACGGGRHSRFLLSRGFKVTALDKNIQGVADLADSIEITQADLEDGSPFPLKGRIFDAVVVTNYLHRPLFPDIIGLLEEGGLLIYETFALGNERFGKPSNPDFLLKPGELLDLLRPDFRILAYEDLILDDPKPAAVQRIAAIKTLEAPDH